MVAGGSVIGAGGRRLTSSDDEQIVAFASQGNKGDGKGVCHCRSPLAGLLHVVSSVWDWDASLHTCMLISGIKRNGFGIVM